MKVIIVGEAMLEYRSQPGTAGGLHYGGDTLNTAIHMVRSGCDVAYVTALGTDPISDALVADWKREGLDIDHVLRHPTRHPGIYAIHVDSEGERSFVYWRDASAARTLFDLPSIAAANDAVAQAELLYFSHISLAILPSEGREALLALAGKVRARGGRVAYDSNYRPRLWDDAGTARAWSDRAIATASIGLPTAEDECFMYDAPASGEAIACRWQDLGCAEVVVKRGPLGPVIAADGGAPLNLAFKALDMVDSSGAGDAFNAGYLAARLRGQSPVSAAQNGHQLAAWVITQPGALPAVSSSAPYDRRVQPEVQP